MKSILKCGKCGEYTMERNCKCSGEVVTPKPAKYSLEDKYGSYRRKAKLKDFEKRGFL